MRQFQLIYTGEQELESVLEDERAAALYPKALFHILCDCWADEQVLAIRNAIKRVFPDAVVVGSSSFGNIFDGRISIGTVMVVGLLFESPAAQLEALYLPLGPQQAPDAAQTLLRAVEQRPWVKAVEILMMINGESTIEFCKTLSALPREVAVFGGESHFAHAEDAPKFVIGDDGSVIRGGAVFVLYGGEDFHIETRHVIGWKPLGYEMIATKFADNVLVELDGRPAHELHYKYLQIENDANFFGNVLEFPFMFETESAPVLRMPVACLDDGSLVLAAAVPETAKTRIAYGDPAEIYDTVKACGDEIAAFNPDAVMLYSCGARRTFWTEERCDRETEPFAGLAPTAGFYTAGELIRDDGVLNEHNCTLIIAALREGPAEGRPARSFGMLSEKRDVKKTLIARFAHFVDTAMDELAKANSELEDANRTLDLLSKTDALTQLPNRGEIERRIRAACEDGTAGVSLVMLDLDDFKAINDRFGHREGDEVLRKLAAILAEAVEGEAGASAGRWGGEEFIVLLEGVQAAQAQALAQRVRERFEQAQLGADYAHTASFGVTQAAAGESADAVINRADKAMYEAKRNGKNAVVVK